MNVYVSGHKGMVGSATLEELKNAKNNIKIVGLEETIDLRNQNDVNNFLSKLNCDAIVIAAARVGGILANSTYPYDFIYDNLMIEANLINAALTNRINKVVFLGSSCIYPKLAPQPLKEEYLLTGPLESTNEWYAIAKIAGIKLCQASNKQFNTKFISLMPTNLYGERDNFDLESSHVLPAMIRKFHNALPDKDVVLWGCGNPQREFMNVKDLAKAIRFVIENDLPDDLYNVGTGKDISIKELALLIQNIVGHKGKIIWDASKPDGTSRKLLDVSKLNHLGWKYEIELEDGIAMTYKWFIENINNLREIKYGKQ